MKPFTRCFLLVIGISVATQTIHGSPVATTAKNIKKDKVESKQLIIEEDSKPDPSVSDTKLSPRQGIADKTDLEPEPVRSKSSSKPPKLHQQPPPSLDYKPEVETKGLSVVDEGQEYDPDRSKYPRIFYGEIVKGGGGEGEHRRFEGGPLKIGGGGGDLPPPKSPFAKPLSGSGGNKRKPKRKQGKSKYESGREDGPPEHSEPSYDGRYSYGYDKPSEPTTEDTFGGYEDSSYGRDQSYSADNGAGSGATTPPSSGGGFTYHRSGTEVLNKALHVLIPSALFLTGLSAVFPNRVHVPTNDYYNLYNNPGHIRHKRSVQHADDLLNDLYPEHRSFGEDSEAGILLNSDEHTSVLKPFEPMKFSSSYAGESHHRNDEEEPTLSPFVAMPMEPKAFDYQYDSSSPFVPSSMDTPALAGLVRSYDDEVKPKKASHHHKMKSNNSRKFRNGKRRVSRPLPSAGAFNSNPYYYRKRDIVPYKKYFQVQKEAEETKMKAAIVSEEAKLLTDALKATDLSAIRKTGKEMDFSPDGPVMGLLTSYAQHDGQSPTCQKRALCELALKGSNPNNATKFESFLWSLASLVPEEFSKLYSLDDIFTAVRSGTCSTFQCNNSHHQSQQQTFNLQV